MTDRTNINSPTGLGAYFETIRYIFELQTKVLTGALPHYAERGRNDEYRIAQFLEKVLPKRYSLGTGFIISSHADLPPSPQIDYEATVSPDAQNSGVAPGTEKRIPSYLAPRGYVVGYDAAATLDNFVERLRTLSNEA